MDNALDDRAIVEVVFPDVIKSRQRASRDDVVQTVWVALLLAKPLGGDLVETTKRFAKELLRRENDSLCDVLRRVEIDENALAASRSDDESVVVGAIVRTTLRKLSKRNNEIFRRRYLRGEKLKTIAEALGLSLSSVSRRCQYVAHVFINEYNKAKKKMINDYFAQPLSWTRLKKWLDGKTTEPRETAEQTLGRAVHARILQPVEYLQRRAIYSAPISPRTGAEYGADTKAAQTARAEFESTLPDDAIVLSEADAIRVERIAKAVAASGFYVDETDRVEAHVERVIEVNGVDVALHGYIDKYADGAVDGYTFANVDELKTTAKPIAAFSGRDKFYWEALELGYLHQLAFYALLLGRDVTNCRFVVAETVEPFRVATVNVRYQTIKRCQSDILEVFLPAWLDQKRPDLILEY